MEQTQQTLGELKDKIVDTVNSTINQAHQTVDNILADQRMANAREFVATEATVAAGYKDQLVGGVKETIGHLVGDKAMERQGREQKREGQAVVGSADQESEENREVVAGTLIKRHALMAQVERTGGVDRAHLNHVDAPEADNHIAELLRQEQFKLKQFNKEPLLEEIREQKTMKPLVHVEPEEKGLLRSVPLGEKDITGDLKRNSADELKKEIAQADLRKLNQVSDDQINDRSGARLDVLKSLSAAQAKRDEVVKQIGSGLAATEVSLKHVETEDKAKPDLSAAAGTKTKKLNKAQLLDEVRQGAELKHVETADKAKPAIGGDVSLKTWNKEGFLAEVRQGADLRQI
jgi:uncharacterized protein YjbJ (UPF0337 family)